jgi:hypothetical protein
MRDLWKELARRVRAADHTEQAEAPLGFADAVLRRIEKAGRHGSSLLDDWGAVLRPAVGLAFATALLCYLFQFQSEREMPTDAVAQTETLIQLAVLND